MEFTPELAAIHAHICGDGNLHAKHEKRSPSSIRTSRSTKPFVRYVLEYTNTEIVLLENFRTLIHKIIPNKYVCWHKSKQRMQVTNRNLYFFLKENGGGKCDEWFVPEEIIYNQLLRRRWLSAFFDDEGTIDKAKIRAYSVNKQGMDQVKRMLELEGLAVKMRDYQSSAYCTGHYYRIDVLASSFEDFEKIGFLHPKKARKYAEHYGKRKMRRLGHSGFATCRTQTMSLEGSGHTARPPAHQTQDHTTRL